MHRRPHVCRRSERGAWTVLPPTGQRGWLYDFLYLWHVPAFLLVTGYLSRSFMWSRPSLTRLVTGVVVPYVVFEAALSLWRLATPPLRSPAQYAGRATRPWAGLLATTALAVVLAIALAARPVARRLEVVVDPVGCYRRRRG